MNTNGSLWMLHVLCFGHCAVCLSWRHIWLAQEVCNGATLTSSLEQAVSVLPLPVPPYTHTHTYKHTCIHTHGSLAFPSPPLSEERGLWHSFILPNWDTQYVLTLKVWCSLLNTLQDAVLQMWMMLVGKRCSNTLLKQSDFDEYLKHAWDQWRREMNRPGTRMNEYKIAYYLKKCKQKLLPYNLW